LFKLPGSRNVQQQQVSGTTCLLKPLGPPKTQQIVLERSSLCLYGHKAATRTQEGNVSGRHCLLQPPGGRKTQQQKVFEGKPVSLSRQAAAKQSSEMFQGNTACFNRWPLGLRHA
jgi:hypothetical protein